MSAPRKPPPPAHAAARRIARHAVAPGGARDSVASSPRALNRRGFLRAAGAGVAVSLAGSGALALMACEKKPPAVKAERGVHLLQWSHLIKEADEEVRRQAAEFQAQTGVKVTIEAINGNDLNARATAAVESGHGPDIIQLLFNQVHLYAGGLAPVDEEAEAIGARHGGWHESAVVTSRVDGRFLAIPYNIVGNAIVYRMDKLNELGITALPETWTELLEVGRKLKRAGMPIGQTLGHTFGDAPGFCYPLLWSFGGRELADDGKTVAINSPETLEALRFLRAFWSEACDSAGMSWDDTSNNRAFLAGTIGATANGASIYFVARQNPDAYPGLADKLNHSLLPKGAAGRFHVPQNFQHGIMRYSPNREAALELVQFLMAKENYEKWFTISRGYSLGAGKAWGKHPMWERDPRVTVYRDMANYARMPGWPGPPNQRASEVQAKYIVIDLFAKVAQGDAPEAALAWADKELKNVYERA